MESIEDIVAQGEGEMLEFKPSFNQDVVETASAFANTRGGRILVGVTNAVCHRDYGDLADIQIKVYDQSLQIWSPGFLPFGMTVEELLRPNHSSKPRNRLIAQAFYDMGMIEQYGSGIERVRNACAEAGLPEPEFENFSGGFQVVFKPLGATGVKATQQVTAQATAQVTAQVAAFCRESRSGQGDNGGIGTEALEDLPVQLSEAIAQCWNPENDPARFAKEPDAEIPSDRKRETTTEQ